MQKVQSDPAPIRAMRPLARQGSSTSSTKVPGVTSFATRSTISLGKSPESGPNKPIPAKALRIDVLAQIVQSDL